MLERIYSLLLVAVTGLVLTGMGAAQGPWYVDGVSGVDAPGRGSSPAVAWKTIGYAMAQAVPGSTTGSSVVYVAGGQSYGAASNGETFPVVMRPGVGLVGFAAGSSGLPVLQIPTGATGVEFASDQNYLRATSVVRALTFSGGARGLLISAQQAVNQEPMIENCRFESQQGWAIDVAGFVDPNQLLRPKVRTCTFVACSNGVRYGETSGNFGVAPATVDIEDCAFLGTQGTSVRAGETYSYQRVFGQVVGCRFDGGLVGVEVGASQNLVIDRCDFRLPSGKGVSVQTASGLSADVTLRDSVFSGCASGLYAISINGPIRPTLARNVFIECAIGANGISSDPPGQWMDARLQDNLFLRCTTGAHFSWMMDVSSSRDRFERCGVGLVCWGGAISLQVSASVFAQNNVGMDLGVSGSVIDGVTVADNAIGLRSQWVYDPFSWVPAYSFWNSQCRNSLFAGNNADLVDLGVGLPPYTGGSTVGTLPLIDFFFNCCFQGTNTTANGNLGLTDPLLSRPTYKLLPGSPCIDRVAPSATTPATDFEGDPRVVAATGTAPNLLDLGADEFVPAGSARPYGTPGIGKGMVFPNISSPNTAVRYGTNLTLDLTGALSQLSGQAASSALLTFGWDDDSGVLPMDLGVFGLSGSLLWNDFVTTFPIQTVSAAGTASYTTAIPNNQALVGLTSTYQWFALMPGGDIVSSNGLRATIGQ